MIRRSSRRFVSRGTRRRRKLVWARASNTPAGTVAGVGSVTATDLLADYVTQAGGDSLNGATLMAIRGRFWAGSVQSGVTSAFLAYGIRLDDASQVALPAAQLLATRGVVTTGRYSDWLARDYYWQQTTAAGAFLQVANEYPALAGRSRRKLDELNSTIALYVENPVGSVAAVYAFQLDLLLALP